MNIGTRLRDLIEAENMTQRQLADILHISPSALNGYINQGKEPDYHTLALLASYFHTSTDYLLGLNNVRTHSFNSLSESEGELLGIYRSLSAHTQQIIYAELKAVYQLSDLA
ncbi:MAG: helix-turn-helix domain-containing protein [Lachnospiraceae bacterium]|nr:helix-turn-helix domain-containing protein [Lachnospiraceae bacterium]MDE7436099.1 helix-turn-helix domain-containing protein [Lachnospiraceae bacterium]